MMMRQFFLPDDSSLDGAMKHLMVQFSSKTARAAPSAGYQITPTMKAGIADHVWTIEEIAALLSSN
jgi:hypothetical protein